jgi:hypothetical protein
VSTHTHTLQVVPNTLVAIIVGKSDDIDYATVNCRDYDHYKSLPDVVSHNGVQMGKTGWNSDIGAAFYQSNANILHVVK